jgi:hypothetical protein
VSPSPEGLTFDRLAKQVSGDGKAVQIWRTERLPSVSRA